MPEICRIMGMVVAMFYNDHAPPHFHVLHRGRRVAKVLIAPPRMLESELPEVLSRIIVTWCSDNQAELMDDWRRARAGLPLFAVAPPKR